VACLLGGTVQFVGAYAEIVLTADQAGTFTLLVSDLAGGLEGTNGPAWMLDLADRIAGSAWAAGHGENATVVSVNYFGQGREIPLT
jgi:hypothetical protein